MGHTYTNLLCHGVFSTKYRKPLLGPEVMPELVKVVGGIIRDRDGKLLAMSGPEDHVHLLAIFHAKRSYSEMFRDIKAISCNWMHGRFGHLSDFAWQEGYAAFSVSRSAVKKTEAYIAGQLEHHRRQTFEAELVALLERHGIDYDPKYLLD